MNLQWRALVVPNLIPLRGVDLMRTRRPMFVSAILLFSVVLTTQSVPACGPFSLDAVFTFIAHPEFPLEKFANGEVGVIQPSFARSYLVVAYRNVTNVRFSDNEQKQLVALWHERLDTSAPDFDDTWPKAW